MLDMLGNRQQEMLQLLLRNKEGLTADELAQQLQITRNAVRQHLAALENDRLVAQGQTRPSGGRPQQLYILTEAGKECFPRRYSWFAQLLLESIKQESGADALGERLEQLGSSVAQQVRSQHPGLTTPAERITRLAEVMNQLGYDASLSQSDEGDGIIEADNCVFHALAQQTPEVCRFDRALMAGFTDCDIDQQQCMAKGGNVCRFRLKAKGNSGS